MNRGRLIVVPLALLLGCGGGGGEDEAAVTPRVPVGVEIVASDTVTDLVTLVGRLTPAPGGSALLTAPAAGVVRRILVQMGAAVSAGALLLELDVPDLEQNARAFAAQAESAERDAKRQQELFREGITSQKQAEQRGAEAVAARAQADAAQQLLARAKVRSPIAGGVQRVLTHPGERVDAGAPLIEVIDGSTLDLVAAVPAAELIRLKVGAAASVLADGASQARPGTVAALAPGVDSLTNAGQVVVRVPNAGHALRAGSGATASVTVGARHRALVIADSALVVLGDSLRVFVVGADSTARARGVTVGVRRVGRAEILAGLAAGERVVVSGAFGLTDGMRVVPQKSTKP